MTQAFRQMPRRVGSHPSGLRKVNDDFQESPAIQSLLRQASQLHHHIQQLPEQSAARGLLQKKLTGFHDQLHQLRSEARALALSEYVHTAAQIAAQTAAQARPFFQALYAEKHPLPRHLRSLYQAAVPQQVLVAFHQALQPLYDALIVQEQRAWQGFWTPWLPIAVSAPTPAVEEVAETEHDGFEVLSFQTPSRSLLGQDLQVSFDLNTRKSTVRNAMGIAMNQPKKSYADYLQDGFQAIDLAVASGFEERYRLEHGVMAFLEAVSLDKSRHEAYFGLGYLYALVQEANHALYFLEVAHRISKDPAIDQFKTEVQAQLGLLERQTPVSA